MKLRVNIQDRTGNHEIVQPDEEMIKEQIKELVRGSVEETLNKLLQQEAQAMTQAIRYERSEQGAAAAAMTETLLPYSGDVTLHVPA